MNPRHLEVEGPLAAERDGEVGARIARAVGLQRKVGPTIRQEQVGSSELGAHVESGVGVGGSAQLLPNLRPVRLGERTEA